MANTIQGLGMVCVVVWCCKQGCGISVDTILYAVFMDGMRNYWNHDSNNYDVEKYMKG